MDFGSVKFLLRGHGDKALVACRFHLQAVRGKVIAADRKGIRLRVPFGKPEQFFLGPILRGGIETAGQKDVPVFADQLLVEVDGGPGAFAGGRGMPLSVGVLYGVRSELPDHLSVAEVQEHDPALRHDAAGGIPYELCREYARAVLPAGDTDVPVPAEA